jgi:peptidoglycan-associated lipoprotein
MVKKSLWILILILCFGLILTGCPKKTVVKDEPSAKAAEEARRAEEQRAREAKEREEREKEQAGIREREAQERERGKASAEASLVPKVTPGIEGVAYESGLLKDIRFDFDRYDVRPEDTAIIKENAAVLTMKLPKAKIQIEGHCDERGTVEYNLALGERRANSAKKYLISLGISADRISTISYGEEKPLDPGHTEEAWTKNRRAHFIIVSK